MILALETATTAASVALVEGDTVLAQASVPQTRRHTEVLMGLIDEVLEVAGVALADVTAMACDIGPGLFTGLRVGVAMAQGFAVAGGLKVIPVTSLFALATGEPGERAALVDARRGEVFVQLFNGDALRPRALCEPLVVAPERLPELIGPEVIVVGSGGEAADTVLLQAKRQRSMTNPVPQATQIGLLAAQVPPSQWAEAYLLRPLYLRDADAKVNFQQRLSPGAP
jgi:tRNA threonylcarbamoyl adenosine modification protein YeaZ